MQGFHACGFQHTSFPSCTRIFIFLWNGMRNALFAVSEVAIQEIYGVSSAHRLYGYAYMF